MTNRQVIRDPGLDRQIFTGRIIFAALAISLVLLIFSSRLYFLQVINHEHFATLSQNNRVRLEPLPPPRGTVFDRNGVVLAENRPAYQLGVVREQVPDLEETLRQLASLLTIDGADHERFRREARRARPFQPIALRAALTDEEVAAFAVNRHLFPGVDIHARPTRFYPLGAAMTHAIGYVGRIDERDLRSIEARSYSGTTHIGKIGIERSYEELLHGETGHQQVEMNAQGRTLRVLDRQLPKAGHDLVLTLDAGLQFAAIEAMKGRRGAVVAIDPRNGEILALVSQPGFDGNLFVHGIPASTYRGLQNDHQRPLFNRALSGQYPPGSTIKPVIGLAGLEHGITTAERTMFAGPWYSLPGDDRRYRDWRPEGHGLTDLDKAIARSVDVYFYDLAHRLGIDRMAEFLDLFGLGKRTGIDTTGEAAGIVPSREWKRRVHHTAWYPGETLSTGIGQGYMLATPLQLAHVAAALSMRGERYRPRLLRGVFDLSGEFVASEAERLSDVEVSDKEFWDQILQPMVHVMHQTGGTGWYHAGQGAAYTMAGKTGTAQVVGISQDDKREEYDIEAVAERHRPHALFIGHAPADNPRIAVAVIVEHGGGGGSVAAPVARLVMDHHLLEKEGDDAGT